eukprot:3200399-Prymnesium_polylepis.1
MARPILTPFAPPNNTIWSASGTSRGASLGQTAPLYSRGSGRLSARRPGSSCPTQPRPESRPPAR